MVLVSAALPDLGDDGGDDVAAWSHDTHEFTDGLGSDMGLRQGANTGHDVIGIISGGERPREVCHVQVAVGLGEPGLLEHPRAEVDPVDLLRIETSEEGSDEAGAAASVQDLNVLVDGGGPQDLRDKGGCCCWGDVVLVLLVEFFVVRLCPLVIDGPSMVDRGEGVDAGEVELGRHGDVKGVSRIN